MEKLLDIAMEQRSKINDFSTVLRLLWIESADLNEIKEIDAICALLQSTITCYNSTLSNNGGK